MQIAVLVLLLLGLAILGFSLMPLKGAPWLPSLKAQRNVALELLDLKPGQIIYDLGCGDGRFLAQAARLGYRAIGYELNPLIFAYAWLTTRKYRKNVQIRFGDYWPADLSDADGIYVFLLNKYMPKLDTKLAKSAKPGLKLVSNGFQIPGKKPAAKKYGLFLYKY